MLSVYFNAYPLSKCPSSGCETPTYHGVLPSGTANLQRLFHLFIHIQNGQSLHITPGPVSGPTSSALHRWSRPTSKADSVHILGEQLHRVACRANRQCHKWWCSAAAIGEQILQTRRHVLPGREFISLIAIAPDSQAAVAFRVEPLLRKNDLRQDWNLAWRASRPFPALCDRNRCGIKPARQPDCLRLPLRGLGH